MNTCLFLLLASLPAAAEQYRAFWADAFNPGFKNSAEVNALVDNAAAAGVNAIFMQARRRGDVYYLKSIEPPAQDTTYSPSFDALEYLIERAHARGIEVHAWLVVSRLWTSTTPPPDPRHVWHSHGPNALGDDFWMSVSSTGAIGNSIDLGHPAAAQHITDLATNLVRDYPNVDGVHLDYIRYNEEAEFGWNPKAIERFQRLENRIGVPTRADARWNDFRRRQVTQVVRQIYLRTTAVKPSIKVTAAVITWGNGPLDDAGYRNLDAYSRVYQDWRGWLEEGILDIAMPMHYFDETRFATYLDRWLAFGKDRQFNRRIMPGLGVYLNTIDNTLKQLPRVLAPSAAGNVPLGVALYSYANTNSGQQPNSTFYQALSQFLGDATKAPELPWKSNPTMGHAMGRVVVDGGAEWLRDGATAVIESDTGKDFARRVVTDGNGFFGSVDLPPDRYRVRLERGGKQVFRTVAKDVVAGRVTEFEIVLKAEDFEPALPRFTGAPVEAAPGDVIRLSGARLASGYGYAESTPLPRELSAAMAVINGESAPLFELNSDFVELQLPYRVVDEWQITMRHGGMESQTLPVKFVRARPVILSSQIENGIGVLRATGLGMVSPAVPAGVGGPSGEPLPRVVERVVVLAGEIEIEPTYAGLEPFAPGRYKVAFPMPPFPISEVRVKVGDAVSPAFSIE